MNNREVIRHPDANALAEAVVGRLVDRVVDAQSKRGDAHVVLTGGGIGTAVLAALMASPAGTAIDWQRIHLWWGDERYLAEGDAERNETGARDALIDHVAIPPDRVHAMAGPDRSDSVEAAAAAYATSLIEAGQGDIPEFDVLLLGIGPDAHVASLFPENSAMLADGPVVAVYNSPKPPPVRVSLSMNTLNRARHTWVLASGSSKAEAIRLSCEPNAEPLRVPASGVQGLQQTLFLVDEAAAAELPDDVGRAVL
ncbi:MAG: 6-phosphogluconolactonase [Actinomycetota bacterium]|nr:6-phosphogluconolactonase [Actinomycetota bacterium]